ncbi:hypothetical protein M9H77_35718 [Catharanthus roseus]|uniref:Uncharacterized protein n=1 Tax=Catharanthus roseus TaxID=4058 RepID=A0ACB9ZQ32_CATRO|nr:hypothetical protein M9H77_35718 [Catharanthus roseus]
MTLPKLCSLFQLLLRKSCSLSMTVIVKSYFIVVPPIVFRAQLGSLSESRHISTTSTPECKETCKAIIGLNGQGPDPETRSSETSLVSCSQYQPNTIQALDYQTTALSKLVKTSGYRFLGHLPNLP